VDIFLGVCHPLEYTHDGDVAPDEPGVFDKRVEMMKAAGVEWVSCDMPFPFEGEMGRASESFRGFLELARKWNEAGLKVLGVTPYPAAFEGGWKLDAGEPGSEKFLASYQEACRFLAAELGELVGAWQVANQLNLERFRRPLTEDGAVEFLERGGAGLKAGNPSALAGVNMFGLDAPALRMYSKLYPNDAVEFDYVGSNGFPGTFEPGGPREWFEKVAVLNELTCKPVVVLEFGYPSRGDEMTQAEREGPETHHDLLKLPYACGGGHSPQAQAEYLEEAVWVLRNSGCVLGAMWFCWTDRPKCWNCRAAGCPAGTSHGLITLEGEPKPSYGAFGRAAADELDPAKLQPGLAQIAEHASGDAEALEAELARALARTEAAEARARLLRGMLASRDRRLARLRGSLVFRLWRWVLSPLAWLAPTARSRDDGPDES